MTRLHPTVLLCVFSLIFPIGASAQMFGGDSRQVNELRQEMSSRIEAGSRAQLELMNQNETLRSEVAKLRGQIEVLNYEIDSLSKRQRDFYVDLDDRLQRLEGTGGGSSSPASADPAATSADYEAALELLRAGQHAQALEALESFISANPRSTLLPSAHFWAGNAALQMQELTAARSYFNSAVSNWPDDEIAPDAMLGLANSQQLMGERRPAQETLQRLLARYPDSAAAEIAQQRIEN